MANSISICLNDCFHTTAKCLERSLQAPTQLLVIDAGVEDSSTLVNGVHPAVKVLVLDSNQNGIMQISQALRSYPSISTLSIFAHGVSGSIHLGNTPLNSAILAQHGWELSTWFARACNPQIHLYSCNVALGSAGIEFIQALHRLTKASIAASTQLVGCTASGSNWQLNYRLGQIDIQNPIAPDILEAYQGVLASPIITDTVTTPRSTSEETVIGITGLTISDTDGGIQTVTVTVSEGIIALATGSGVTVTGSTAASITFTGTIAQVNAAINGMNYTPSLDYADDTTLSISSNDGTTTVTKVVAIAVTPVNDTPTIAPSAATVAEGGNVNFVATNFGIADVDNIAAQIIVKVAALPGKGFLVLDGGKLAVGSSFSSDRIPDLKYVHDGTQTTAIGGTSDSFSITVADGAGGIISSTAIPITITPVNQLPTVTGSTILFEGESNKPVTIIINDLDQTAANYTIKILSQPVNPAHGTLTFNGIAVTVGQTFSSADLANFTYSHFGNDENFGNPPNVTFDIEVLDDGGGTGIPGAKTATITLGITANNDDPILDINTGITLDTTSVREVVITNANLNVTDPDSGILQLTYTVSQTVDPTLGSLQLNGSKIGMGATFTQADINQGRLKYVFNKNTTAGDTFTDSFKFEVRDSSITEFPTVREGGIYSGAVIAENIFAINISTPNAITDATGSNAPTVVANIAPVIASNLGIGQPVGGSPTLDEGGSVAITAAMLSVTDPDNSPEQLVYRVEKSPTNGTFKLSGSPVNLYGSFTQKDINDGKVSFEHRDSEDFIDIDITFSVSDGINLLKNQKFKLDVIPKNDAPVVTVGTTVSLAEGTEQTITTANFSLSDVDGSGEKIGQGFATVNSLTFKVTELPINGDLYIDQGLGYVKIDASNFGTLIITNNQLTSGKLKYVHAGDENVADSFKVQALDDSGTPNNFSPIQTVNIEIAKINDAPVLSGPVVNLTVAEAGTGTIKGSNALVGEPRLVYTDPDNSTIQRQYAITSKTIHGAILLNGKTLAVGSVFTQEDLDTDKVTYKHDGTEFYIDSFNFEVRDGAAPPVPGSYGITITPTNDSPTLTVPVTQTFATTAPLVFSTANSNSITFADPDLVTLDVGETDVIRVTLDLQAAGATYTGSTLTLGSTTGVTVTFGTNGIAGGKIVFDGTKANIQAALEGLQVQVPLDEDRIVSLVVTIDDRNNGGPDAPIPQPTTVTKTININASNVNDAPTIPTTPASVTVAEDTFLSFTGANAIAIQDVDSFSTTNNTVTLSVSQGTLNLTLGAATISSGANGTGTITLTGSLASINAAIASLLYKGNPEYNGNDSLSVVFNDAGNLGTGGAQSVTQNISITVKPVNDTPAIVAPGSTLAIEDGNPLTFNGANLISIDDAKDLGSSGNGLDTFTVTVEALNGATPYGSVQVTTGSGATISNDNTASVTISGTKAQVNAALNGLSYTPADNNVDATVTLKVTAKDQANGGTAIGGTGGELTDIKNILINVSGVNDAAVVTAPLSVTVTEDTPFFFPINSLKVDDPDDFGKSLKVTLTVGNGTLTFGATTGLTVTGTGTSRIIQGKESDINAALDTLQYQGNSNYNTVGINKDVLTILVDDLGNTGTGGAKTTTKTVDITVTPVNDAPIASSNATVMAVVEDSANPLGTAVSTLLSGNYNDVADTVTGGTTATPLAGIAIVNNTAIATQGNWQYFNGSIWTNVPTIGLSDSNALVVAAADQLRFLPTTNFNGKPGSLTVHLSDGTAFTTGSSQNVGTRGGTSGWSANTVVIDTTITAINDAPVASGTATLVTVNEDVINPPGNTVSGLFSPRFSDTVDTVTVAVSGGSTANTLAGIAIVSNTANPATEGKWQYFNGSAWVDVGTRSTSSALLVKADDNLRFLPVTDFNGMPPGLTANLIDTSGGAVTSATIVDLSIGGATGGTTPYSSATVPLTTNIASVNDVPLFTKGANQTVNEDAGIQTVPGWATGISAGAPNESGQILSFIANNNNNALFSSQPTIDASGNLVYTPAANANGVAIVTVQIKDNGGTANTGVDTSATQTFTITINPVNDAPTVVTTASPTTFTEANNAVSVPVVVDAGLTVGDIDSPTLTTAMVTITGGFQSVEDSLAFTNSNPTLYGNITASYSNITGTLSLSSVGGTATLAQWQNALRTIAYSNNSETPNTGDRTLSFKVNDGGLDSTIATKTLKIVAVNDTPIAINDVNTIAEDAALPSTGNVLTNDTDADQPNSALVVSQVNGSTINVGQSVVGTNGSIQINNNGSYNYTLDNLKPTVQALAVGQTLTETFTYQVSDGNGGTATANVIITINGTNDAPVANADVNSITEDAATPATGNVLTNDTDVDAGATRTVSQVNDNSSQVGTLVTGTYGSITINPDGTYSYTLNNTNTTVQALPVGQTLSETFTYQVTDDQGGTASTTLTITIQGANDLPIANPDVNSVAEDATAPITGNVLSNDTDPDSDPRTVSQFNGSSAQVGTPVTGTYGSITINPDGTYSYTLNNTNPAVQALPSGQNLSETFNYQLSDGNGGTATTTLTITITGTNDLPVANADSISIAAGTATPFTGNALNNDTDPDTGAILTVSKVNGNPTDVGQPITSTYGEFKLNTDGTYSYAVDSTNPAVIALPLGQFLTETFTYEIADGQGGTSNTTITVTIGGENNSPIINPDTNNIDEDAPSINGNVLTNDTDIDTGTILSVSKVNSSSIDVGQAVTGSYGTLTLNSNGSYSYNLNSANPIVQQLAIGSMLTDSFTYEASDGAGGTATTTLVLTINGTNDAPVANADVNSITEDAATPATGNVLTNDTDVDAGATRTVSQVNGNSFQVGTPVTGTYGLITINSDGTYSYTLNNTNTTVQALAVGQTLSETFNYQATDDQGGTASTTLTITIQGTNDLPIANPDTDTVAEDATAPITGNVLLNDTDPDGDPRTVSQVNGNGAQVGQPVTGTYGSITINPDGTYSYTLNNTNPAVQALPSGQNLTETFNYQLSDGKGGTATTTLTITVTGTNDAPTANPDIDSVTSNDLTPATGNVITNDTDPDTGTTLTVSQVNGNSSSVGQAIAGIYGSLTLNSNGTYSYILNNSNSTVQALPNGQTLTELFNYEASDGLTGTAVSTLTITINGANDPPAGVDRTVNTDEDTPYTLQITDFSFTDGDTGNIFQGVRIDTLPAKGTLSFNGSPITSPGTVISASDIGLGKLVFTPIPNDNGSNYATFTFSVQDSSGIAATEFDPMPNTMTIGVTPINDSPVASGTPTLVPVSKNNANPPGATITDLFTPSFSDPLDAVPIGASPNTLAGIAIVDNPITPIQGTWEYFNSTTWQSVGSPTLANALIISANNQLRFVPATGYSGPVPPLTIRVIDNSGGAVISGTSVNLTGVTATSPYSANTVQLTTSIRPDNTPPAFTALDGTPAFTEGGSAIALDSNATVDDIELGGSNWSGATLKLERQTVANREDTFENSGTLGGLIESNPLTVGGTTIGIVTTNSSGTLLLTFNASATTASVNSVLQQITYRNTGDNPAATVAITYTINDGNTGAQGNGGALIGTGSVSVNITPVNDPPNLDLDGNNSSGIIGKNYQVLYTPGQLAKIADTDVKITDVDDLNMESATLILTTRPNGSSESLTLTGTLPSGINASAYDPLTGILKLTGSASIADYQAAIASITYKNTTAAQNTSNRTVTVMVNDGEKDSSIATTTILFDSDGDRSPDSLDLDDDNDGIPDLIEQGGNPNRDTDGDGIPDTLDLDADNDGITDLQESGLSTATIAVLDKDNDGVIDPTNNFGSNGLSNSLETSPDSGILNYVPVDTDGDQKPNFQDLDSDNDGLTDLSESGAGYPDGNGDKMVDGIDSDGDGILDPADRGAAFGGGSRPPLKDSNNNGIPDFMEISVSRAQGSNGSDTIIGTDGDDILNGFSDLDTIYGRGGNDLINGGSDRDVLRGDEGNDTISGGTDSDDIQGGTGNDSISGGDGNDLILGNDGDDVLSGDRGNDRIYGGKGKDTINGSDGNDRLYGDEDNDIVRGYRGNDLLVGGAGKDELTGGQGRDIFKYRSVKELGDVITDFEIVKDRFDLRNIFHRRGSMSNIELQQRGKDTIIGVSFKGKEYTLGLLEDVHANTLKARHFKF